MVSLKHRCCYEGCEYVFAKSTHLERHQRTHTNLRNFACPHCRRLFSRKDSRDRHYSRWHASLPSAELSTVEGRPANVLLEEQGRSPAAAARPASRSSSGEAASSASSKRPIRRPRRDAPAQKSSATQSLASLPQFNAAPDHSQQIYKPVLDTTVLPSQRYYQDIHDTAWPPCQTDVDTGTVGVMSDAFIADTERTSKGLLPSSDVHDSGSIPEDPRTSAVPTLSPYFGPMVGNLLWESMEASFATTFGNLLGGQDLQLQRAETTAVQQPVPRSDTHRAATDLGENDQLLRSAAPAAWSNNHLSHCDSAEDWRRASDSTRAESVSRKRQRERPVQAQPVMEHQDRDVQDLRLPSQRTEGEEIPRQGQNTDTLVEWMRAEVHRMVVNIKTPQGTDNDFAQSCLWLYQRNLHPHSPFWPSSNPRVDYADKPALLMNLLALGSLWHEDESAKAKGLELWKFTLRTVWSKGLRSVQTDDDVETFISTLFAGHSYVLRTSDQTTYDMGRRAWLFAHSFLHEKGWRKQDEAIDAKLYGSLANDGGELQEVRTKWRSEQEKIRVILHLGIHDSQQARSLQLVPALQSTVAETYLPAPDCLLEATSMHEWLRLYHTHYSTPSPRRRLGSVAIELFSPFTSGSDGSSRGGAIRDTGPASQEGPDVLPARPWMTDLALLAVLENVHATWYTQLSTKDRYWERWDSESSGRSSQASDLRMLHVLANWRALEQSSPRFLSDPVRDTPFLEIRWHAIHIAICASRIDMVGHLRSRVAAILPSRPTYPIYPSTPQVDELPPGKWFHSPMARRALYHAGAIFALLGTLPRSVPCPVHVVQAVLDSALLLVALAVTWKEDAACMDSWSSLHSSQPFELVSPPAEDWQLLGLAGFEDLVSQDEDNSRARFGWPTLASLTADCDSPSGSSAAKQWIQDGPTSSLTFENVKLDQLDNLLRAVLSTVESNQLVWCFAPDCIALLRANAKQLRAV